MVKGWEIKQEYGDAGTGADKGAIDLFVILLNGVVSSPLSF